MYDAEYLNLSESLWAFPFVECSQALFCYEVKIRRISFDCDLGGLSHGWISERTDQEPSKRRYELCENRKVGRCFQGCGHILLPQERSAGNKKTMPVERTDAADVCRECGKPLVQVDGMKRRVFCSKECRVKWWKEHPERLNQRAVYQYTCPHCGKPFSAYGNSKRKYCSHACYISDRFGGGADE